MICNYCEQEFTPNHFNQKLCSDFCKSNAVKRAKNKYKKKEKGIASNKRWVNSDKRKENEKRYRQQPRRRRLGIEATKRYIKTHPEKKAEWDRSYSETEHGRETRRRASERYRRSERGKEVRRISKAKRRNAEGSFTPEEWASVLENTNGFCACCGSDERIEIDHIMPISKGGKNTIDNVQPLCRSCNARKGAKHVNYM